MKIHPLVAAAAFGSLAMGIGAHPAQAEPTRLFGQCTTSTLISGNHTTCDAKPSYALFSEAEGAEYALRLTAPSTHCSKVRYAVYTHPIDGPEREVGYTDFLGPGEYRNVALGQLRFGQNSYYIMALGMVGGCNEGRLDSWAVDVDHFLVPR